MQAWNFVQALLVSPTTPSQDVEEVSGFIAGLMDGANSDDARASRLGAAISSRKVPSALAGLLAAPVNSLDD